MNSLEIACLCARAADQRKAENVMVLDVRKISSVTDFFVIASGQVEQHLKAIRDEVDEKLHEAGVKARAVDGFPMSQWVVMDYTDVLVHIFAEKTREFYALEKLWGDAPVIDWDKK